MRHRLAVLRVATALCALISWPVTQAAVAQSQSSGLTLPAVTGSLARGGQFTGALTITRLSNRAGQLVADGIVAGNVSTEPVWATPASIGVPLTGASVFSATSTPTPTYETVSTSAPLPPTATSLTLGGVATATATLTPGIVLTATPTPTSAGTDQLPRTALLDETVSRSAQSIAVSQSFRDIPMTLVDPDLATCDVLNLDLGVLFMDQLGAHIDLAPAVIDIATLPRTNRPLGGLLCTVASLVDLGPSSSQAATLNELLPIVNRTLSTAPR